MRIKNRKTYFSFLAIFVSVLLAAYLISLIVPVFWTIMTSLKTIDEYENLGPNYSGNPLWWFKYEGPTFAHFATAFRRFMIPAYNRNGDPVTFNIIQQFANSILYSVGCSVATTGTAMIMGYATARFKYRFSNFIYAFVVATMALPIVGALPSEIRVATKLDLMNRFIGIWIMRATFLNTYFLIFNAQFKMIPYTYTEAAKIDGANPLSIMVKIILPLATGTISTVFVLNLIAYWNDFQIPMIYLESFPVAAYGMYVFKQSPEQDIAHIPTQMAGIWLMAMPIVIFYAIFNKKLTVNLSVGGIKG